MSADRAMILDFEVHDVDAERKRLARIVTGPGGVHVLNFVK